MIAFLILAHSDAEQVRRLVSRLGSHDVFVHVDAKTRMGEDWKSIPAEFVRNRVPVYWAGFSQVRATLELLKAALGNGKVYERIVLLSGSCYPIRPIEDLESYFRSSPETNHIKYVAVDDSTHLRQMSERYYFREGFLPWRLTAMSKSARYLDRVLRKLAETAVSPIAHKRTLDWTLFHGSAYWALTQECARYVFETASGPLGTQLAKFYRRSFASDEQFFHTIVGNSSFAGSSSGRKAFVANGTFRMANLHVIDPTLARWFTYEDLTELVSSGEYFVRKVRTESSTQLLDALDDLHGGVPASCDASGPMQG